MEPNRESSDFNRLDMFRINIKPSNLKRTFEQLSVNDGAEEFKLVNLPVVLSERFEVRRGEGEGIVW